jgi:ribokinase
MIVVGSVNMDIVVRAPRAPAAGETVLGADYALYPGGKGANQAVAARRAGGAVAFIGCLGRDAYGEALHAVLADEGILLAGLARVEAPTGIALITVENGGENRIIVVPGANHALTAGHLPDLPGGLLLLQLEIPLTVATEAAMRARRAGGTVILNPSPIAALPDALLGAADILLVNETEAAQLLGRAAAPEDAARQLALGRRAAVVTLGGSGALWSDGKVTRHVPGHQVEVVDTTACGDAFAGAFAAALDRGAALEAAVELGNAAGALAATRAGAQPSLPGWDTIEALLQSGVVRGSREVVPQQ